MTCALRILRCRRTFAISSVAIAWEYREPAFGTSEATGEGSRNGVHERDGLGAGLAGRARERGKVGRYRRQLHYQRAPAHGAAARPGHARAHDARCGLSRYRRSRGPVNRMIKWIFITVGTLAALVAVMAIVGALLPVAHRASRTVTLDARSPA